MCCCKYCEDRFCLQSFVLTGPWEHILCPYVTVPMCLPDSHPRCCRCASTVRDGEVQHRNGINCLAKSTLVVRMTPVQNERSEVNGSSDVEGITKLIMGNSKRILWVWRKKVKANIMKMKPTEALAQQNLVLCVQ